MACAPREGLGWHGSRDRHHDPRLARAPLATDGLAGWPTAATIAAYLHLGLVDPGRWQDQLDVLRNCFCWWPSRGFTVFCERPGAEG